MSYLARLALPAFRVVVVLLGLLVSGCGVNNIPT